MLSKYLKYKKKYFSLKSTLTGGNPNYKTFTKSDKDLETEFLEDLIEYGKTDEVCKILFDILKKYLNSKKLNFNLFENDELGCYLITIVGRNDNILIQLGTHHNFPRGFPIIWRPKQILNMYGFYPKFENDKMEEHGLNKSELDSGIEINFNFKYSGFLGQVIPFTIDGINYWTTAGKNWTNYIYSEIVRDLMNPIITTELLQILCDNKLHICGETISK